jgi:RES domain-containing protein
VAASEPLPPVTLARQHDTHRFIASKRGQTVLTRIADSDQHLADIFELENATNDRALAEAGFASGIGVGELLFGIPYYRIVNAAFTHPHPLGSRFNGPERGAWYCGFELATSQAEVAFHKTIDLAEIGIFEDDVTYDDYTADFSAELHDLRGARNYARCLDPDSYVASQRLAERLLERGSLGVVYPSVRNPGGTCIACFRPALVGNVRKAETYRFVWDGSPEPAIALAPSRRTRPRRSKTDAPG